MDFEVKTLNPKMKKASETPVQYKDDLKGKEAQKPYFRPAKDDTKPLLQDPVKISAQLFPFLGLIIIY